VVLIFVMQFLEHLVSIIDYVVPIWTQHLNLLWSSECETMKLMKFAELD
jgi:hypothetical protein